MSVNLAPGPFGAGAQFFDANGKPLNAGLINTYTAGSSTPQPTYTTSIGNVANANPIVLGVDGRPPSEIWLTAGVAYKFVLTDSLSNILGTYDNLVGINDISPTSTSIEWITSALTGLSYISGTSFSVSGDQTGILTVNRRIKTTNTGGTIYSYISASSFGAGVTTVTVVSDSGSLDSGLSALFYGILNPTNPSIPQTSTRRAVTMYWSPPNIWTVYGPSGNIIPTPASTTQGLQEAINAACTALNITGYDLYIFGGDVSTGGAAVILCTTAVTIPPTQGKHIYISSASIIFTAAVTGDGLTFNSQEMMSFEMPGSQIGYAGNGAAVKFNPTTGTPLDNLTAIIDSTFRFGSIGMTGGTNPVGVAFSMGSGSIVTNLFEFEEVNASTFGQDGIVVNDGTVSNGFNTNTVICRHLHEFSRKSLAVGTATTHATGIVANTFNINAFPAGASSVGVDVYGQNNIFNVSIVNSEGTTNTGINLQTSAAKNQFQVSINQAVIPVTDNSTTKDNVMPSIGALDSAKVVNTTYTAATDLLIFFRSLKTSADAFNFTATAKTDSASPPTTVYAVAEGSVVGASGSIFGESGALAVKKGNNWRIDTSGSATGTVTIQVVQLGT